jgi:hypothetical protein
MLYDLYFTALFKDQVLVLKMLKMHIIKGLCDATEVKGERGY